MPAMSGRMEGSRERGGNGAVRTARAIGTRSAASPAQPGSRPAQPPFQQLRRGPMHSQALYRLTWLAAALSLGHHLDHLIRHNAVGWPLTDQVNAFTLSLVVYPLIATGLLA